jgi:hypothetical protein
VLSVLFAEEVGAVLEVRQEDVVAVVTEFTNAGVSCQDIGRSLSSTDSAQCKVRQRCRNRFFFWSLESLALKLSCLLCFRYSVPSSFCENG